MLDGGINIFWKRRKYVHKFHNLKMDKYRKITVKFEYWNGWMTCDSTSFATVFQSYQDKERLCAMQLRLRMKKSSPQAGFEHGTARSASQRFTTADPSILRQADLNKQCSHRSNDYRKRLYFAVTEFWRYWRFRPRVLKWKSANISFSIYCFTYCLTEAQIKRRI